MKEQTRVKNLNEADQSFYRKLLVVGIPMVIQQVIAVTLNLADTIMAIRSSDTPLIMGSVIVLASIFTILNLVIDLLYSVIDPRIKAQFAK